MASATDIHHMRSALTLARRGLGRTWPNPSVGCVIVNKDGHVIGRGVTGDGGRPHAETLALARAGSEAKGGSIFVSLEPCAHHGQTPPCTGFIIESGIKRVVAGCVDPDPRVAGQGIRQLQAAGIAVEVGVLEAEAREVNRGFILRVTENRPLVTLKSATSVDEKIATQVGTRTQISGEMAMRRVHLERARHDAILVGIGTVLADDPLLTTRLPGFEHNSVRIVLDTHLRMPKDSRLVQTATKHPLWIVHNVSEPGASGAALEKAGARLLRAGSMEPKAVLGLLAAEGITRVLVEGGAKINTSFLKSGFCDYFLHFRSPMRIGDSGVPALEGYGLTDLAGFGFGKASTVSLGEDLLEIYTRRQ